MKKNILILTISLMLLFFLSESQLHSADISLGATTWYTAWDFDWEGSDEIKYDPGFLYGPVLSLAITPEFSMSFIFLYGTFTQSMENWNEETEIKRYDSDLTINYRVAGNLKVFAGIKYISFTWPDGDHKALGPGAGISMTEHLGGNFFLLGYLSGMYLEGNENGSTGDNDYDTTAKEYGGNASASLAYYIPGASTTISFGGRYQQIKIDYKDEIENMVEDNRSRFYGVTLSAVYTFNI